MDGSGAVVATGVGTGVASALYPPKSDSVFCFARANLCSVSYRLTSGPAVSAIEGLGLLGASAISDAAEPRDNSAATINTPASSKAAPVKKHARSFLLFLRLIVNLIMGEIIKRLKEFTALFSRPRRDTRESARNVCRGVSSCPSTPVARLSRMRTGVLARRTAGDVVRFFLTAFSSFKADMPAFLAIRTLLTLIFLRLNNNASRVKSQINRNTFVTN